MSVDSVRPRRSRWTALVVVSTVCILGAGTWFVLSRGMRRTALLDKAVSALAAGNRGKGEMLLREVLAATPADVGARRRLVALLLEARRYDEAEAEASEWTRVGRDRVGGRKALSEIALRRHHLDEAERIARSLADQDPVFAHLTTIRVHELRGSPADRLRSAEAAGTLASLSPLGIEKVGLLLHAGETMLDLSYSAPATTRSSLARWGRRYLEQAETTLKSSVAGKDLRDLTDRIRLLSEAEEIRSLAARRLASSLTEGPKAAEAGTAQLEILASLSWFHARFGEFESAVAYARRIQDHGARGFLWWLRAYRRLEMHGCPWPLRLSALDACPVPDFPALPLLRAAILLKGDEADQARGTQLLKEVAGRTKENVAIGIDAYRMLAAVGGVADRGLLETVSDLRPSVQTEALVASLAAGTPDGRERALRVIASISGRIETRAEGIHVLELMRQGGRATLEAYLDAPIEGAGTDRAHRLLLRAVAATIDASKGAQDDLTALVRATAFRDLEALRDLPMTSEDLEDAWQVAAFHGLRSLAGRLVARAASVEDASGTAALGCLILTAHNADPAQRAEWADGVRGGTDPEAPRPLLEAIASAIEDRSLDTAEFSSRLSMAAADPRSKVRALFLSVRVAYRRGDRDRAEAEARALVALRPKSVEALQMLADLLLERKAFAEALEVCPEGPSPSAHAYRVRALALWGVDRRDEAIEAARSAVRDHPARADLHLLLAVLHLRAGRKEQALAGLSVAPLSRDVAVLRARLLGERGEQAASELLFAVVLAADASDVEAWTGFASSLSSQGRHEDLVRIMTSRLEATDALDAALRGEFLVARGAAREALGNAAAALADYEEGLKGVPRSVIALNNAAWLIPSVDPSRLDAAREYVQRALNVAPNVAGVLDTASHVAHATKDLEGALAYADRAIALSAKPSYMLRKARILTDLGRADAAREEYERVVRSAPAGSPEAREAADALRRQG